MLGISLPLSSASRVCLAFTLSKKLRWELLWDQLSSLLIHFFKMNVALDLHLKLNRLAIQSSSSQEEEERVLARGRIEGIERDFDGTKKAIASKALEKVESLKLSTPVQALLGLETSMTVKIQSDNPMRPFNPLSQCPEILAKHKEKAHSRRKKKKTRKPTIETLHGEKRVVAAQSMQLTDCRWDSMPHLSTDSILSPPTRRSPTKALSASSLEDGPTDFDSIHLPYQ
jgi:hypothetical protein